jgi:peptide/nickel transport system substrate-binding protein
MKKLLFAILGVILVSSLIFSGCAGTSTTSPPTTTRAPAPPTTTLAPPPQTTTQAPPPAKTTTAPPTTAPTFAPTTVPPSTGQPQSGGVFRQITGMGPINIGDPAVVPGIPTYYGPVGESLWYSDKDGNPAPCLATSWDFSPDGKSITFHLRKGVKFQDGTDFNAAAVKWCLDRGRTGQAPGLKPVTSVDIVDDYTIKVNMPSYDYSVWDSLGGQRSPSWIVSPTSIEKNAKDWPLLHVVGTGAFKITDYQRDLSMTYQKFTDYWQKPLPYLDGVTFLIIANPTTALMTFKGGQADMINNLAVSDANDLKSGGKFNIITTPGMSVMLAFSGNTKGSPFTDIKVRQAVCYAIDTKTIAAGVGSGYYLPSNQAFPPWMWAYNPNITGYPYNPGKAKQLLSDAGYPNGFKTTIYMQSGQSQDMQIAVQSYLKDVGIQAEVQTLAPPNIAQMMTTGGWDGLMTGQLLTISGMDPGALMQGMGFVNRGPYYISVIRTDDTLALLNQANAEMDAAKRKALLQQMGKLIIDTYCMVAPIYFTQGLNALQPNVHDIGMGEFRFSYEKAWLSK